jgi:deazaflavin-dependent oxidoreductase (nitroreductase family)
MNAGAPAAHRVSRPQRLANRMLSRALRKGRGPRFLRLLTVTDRRTGRPLTTPVAPVFDGEQVWIVSPYGEVNWVRNLRASGLAELARGVDEIRYDARELGPAKAVAVLRTYLAMPSERFVRKDFAITTQSSDEAIAAEAPRHPVFALTPHPGPARP